MCSPGPITHAHYHENPLDSSACNDRYFCKGDTWRNGADDNPVSGLPPPLPLFFALFLPQSGLNLASDNIFIGEPDMDVCDLSVPPNDHQIGYRLRSV